jgi:3-hydroxyacyl-CoA dehydrogenase/enoyl-CoA hydratase/3-hydroxybutyryl-CoA epimerase
MKKIRVASKTAVEEEGGTWEKAPAEDVIDTMIELGRSSKLVGKGFFDYDENGKRTGLWPGLAETFPVAEEQLPFQDIKDRLVFVMSLDTVRCLEEGVLRTVPDANIGSIFGIGFPPMHGGAIQYINGYEAVGSDGSSRTGVEAFTERAQELAQTYGDHFEPPALLLDKAKNGEKFA